MIFLSFYLFFLVKTFSANEIISVDIEYGVNESFIFNYELTTNTSYYLTFRLFEHEQINFGLFPSTIHFNTFKISNQYKSSSISSSSSSLFYLFIICFHFLYEHNDLDIQCKDLRLLKTDLIKSPLPSYKPLFVPMMYALSVLVLLPVIIQHRRDKHEKFLQRRRQIRRLSLNIAHENPEILSNLISNGTINRNIIPTQSELFSFPSTRTILDDIDDNENITFTLDNPSTYNEEIPISADECVAHLLDSTPWSTKHEEIESKFVSTDIDNEQEPILKSNTYCTINLYRSNPAFLETDV